MEILSIRDRVWLDTGDEGWVIHIDGSIRHKGQVVVHLREEILKEFHYSHFVVHLGGTKMYHDLHR